MLILTHTEVTNTMSTVYTTLDYEYWHENKGSGPVFVPRKCGVYRWHQKSYKMCTVLDSHGVHTKCSSSHTQIDKSLILFPLFIPLKIMNTDMRTKVVIRFGTLEMMLNWEQKIVPIAVNAYAWVNSHTHMYRTFFNHITSQRNSGIWFLASRQRYWSNLVLQGWCL